MSPLRTALVTGASGAIGSAVARALDADGVRLALHYHRRRETIEALRDSLTGEAILVEGDLTDGPMVEEVYRSIHATTGPPDILVYSAGVLTDAFLAMMKEQTWDECVDLSLKGAFLCTRHALRGMTKGRWGRIIYIGSTAGLTGDVARAHYAAAKAGLIGLARSVAREVGRGGITANVVCPGIIDSPMTASMSDRRRDELLARIPVGRQGTPEEVASLVRYLSTDAAGYITGAIIPVDGGLSM